MTHRGDMSKKGVQLLIGVEDVTLSKIIGRRDRTYALPPRLLVERLCAASSRHLCMISSARGRCHLQ